MSKQLTIGDILEVMEPMKKRGMTDEEIRKTPIYIGDDDELNGIHTAWYVDIVDINDETYVDFIDMINGYPHNIKLKGTAIVIT